VKSRGVPFVQLSGSPDYLLMNLSIYLRSKGLKRLQIVTV
jgi:hypothetical protein